MHCRRCGDSAPATAKFCWNCGAAMERRTADETGHHDLSGLVSRAPARDQASHGAGGSRVGVVGAALRRAGREPTSRRGSSPHSPA